MDEKTHQELKDKVEQANTLRSQVKALDEVIKSCKGEVGYMNIIANFKNQNEVNLVQSLDQGARDVFDAFKTCVHDGAVSLKTELEAKYKNLI